MTEKFVLSPLTTFICMAFVVLFVQPLAYGSQLNPVKGASSPNRFETRVRIVAKDEVTLASQLAGRIKAIPKIESQRFKRGDVLVKMDCAIHEARRLKAQAELSSARHSLESKKELLSYNSGTVHGVALARDAMNRAGAELLIHNATVSMCNLKAPFAGLVVKRKARAFQSVTVGQPILEILNDTILQAHMIVPSNWLKWIKKDTKFRMRLDETGRSYNGVVSAIGARIDVTSQSVNIVGTIKGKQKGLISGMSGLAVFSNANVSSTP
ncbi:MAG: efflux RND transporter periplasmic adaptor subunit [Magnetococcales bacterium]|nr:efflux RND transporter periplasmic adaptor subunit [Magnetococcales bacterium]